LRRIVLPKIGCLNLLPRLYSSVYVSEQVYAEVVVGGAGQPGASEVAEAGLIEVKAIEKPDDLAAARRRFGMGLGELATIILAKEIGAPLVLMDDTRGRRVALSEGLDIRGALGIVESLFRRGELPDLRSAFEQLLRAQAYLERNLLSRRLTLL
jgi:predicted nucleic acid-binding protein